MNDQSFSSFTEKPTRRQALAWAVAAVGGVASASQLAACSQSEPVAPGEPGRFFSADAMKLLAETADIILQDTDTPGAKAVNVHGFIDDMMMDWAVDGTRDQFNAVVAHIGAQAESQFSAPFNELSRDDQTAVIAAIDETAFSSGWQTTEGRAYRRLKELVFVGYYTSEIGATQELQFQLVPGGFDGCVPLEEVGRTWAEERG